MGSNTVTSKSPASADGTMPLPNFRIIIVGAGVAGLVASHCLQKAGVDHVVLERRTDVAPPMGSSIAMYPNGARILHQIGCLEAMKASCVPCHWSWTRGPDGKSIVDNAFFEFVKENHGQDILLLERRQFLQNLYDCLPDKSRVRLGCEVSTIEQNASGVEVILTDETVEKGDMVLGADGVRSPVRSMMWEQANKTTPGLITVQEKTCMKTRWKLLLGMGPQASELGERDMTVCHDSNHSLMTLTQPNHTYFSVFFKLDKEHSWPKQQRYTEQEAEAAAASVADHPVSDSMVFGELWKKRDRAALIGVEEGVLDHWYDGRIVLAGDCVHKMTPNIGLGGNMALESVVVLCNHLQSMLVFQQGAKPSRATLRKAFQAYQDERRPRVIEVIKFSGQVTDAHAWVTPLHKYYTKLWLPLQSDRMIPDAMAEIIRRGPKLAYVDANRFGEGRVPWKDDESASKGVSGEKRRWLNLFSVKTIAMFAVAAGVVQYNHVLSLLRVR